MKSQNISSTVLLLVTALTVLPPCARAAEQLGFHEIRMDAEGHILPWYAADPGVAYDHSIRSLWDFWNNMKSCTNGVKYYMQHAVWSDPIEDARGLGGDQLSMALSSENLLHGYLGDRSVVDNMIYIADYWLDHGMSPANAAWPNLPYPYNTDLHSGIYDGDMRAGKGFLQPDKAGSFGYELVVLYKITGNDRYLKSAIAIADTLAGKVVPGDADHSPWPFRVNAQTEKIDRPYTTAWTGTLRLFDSLIELNQGNAASYTRAHSLASNWLRKNPLQSNKWGPFFEDIQDWSDTEINADSLAYYILEHPTWSSDWKADTTRILEWSDIVLGNRSWAKYAVTAINEQTAYAVPGNSHTARHASVELLFSEKTGEQARKAPAIRKLNWTTYMLGNFGDNCYPYDDVWLSDGYGDSIRHYLRAMASAPELAPPNQSHLLRSSSVIQQITYASNLISYATFDASARELLRIAFVPGSVTANGVPLPRLERLNELDQRQGYMFEAPGDVAGVLRIRHDRAARIVISVVPAKEAPITHDQTVEVQVGGSKAFRLQDSADTHLNSSKPLIYSIYGPFRGKLSGTAPDLVYQAPEGSCGGDVITFQIRDGDRVSQVARVTFNINRPSLTSLAAARPFTTEDPGTGVSGKFLLPGLTDGDIATSIEACCTNLKSDREIAVGVLWPAAEPVCEVVFQQGYADQQNGGCFNRGFRLQLTADGESWSDEPSATLLPGAYPGNVEASMRDFVFSFPNAVQCRGVRVVGSIGTNGDAGSSSLQVRELQAFSEATAPLSPKAGWQMMHDPVARVVAEGDLVSFDFRLENPSLLTYQWQRSKDGGLNWTDIIGANDGFYAFTATPRSEFDGNIFRCLFSDGGNIRQYSRPAALNVLPAATGHHYTSGTPLH